MKRTYGLALGFGLLFLVACGDSSSSSDGANTTGSSSSKEKNSDAGASESTTKTQSSSHGSGADNDAGTNMSGSTEANMSTDDAGTQMLNVSFTDQGAPCGSSTCNDLLIEDLDLTVKGCCVDDTDEVCGLNMTTLGLLLGLSHPGCEPLDLPGSPSPECGESPEKVAIGFNDNMPFHMQGCCQASGTCGYDASFGGLGFGCVDPERFGDPAGADCEYIAE